MLSRIYTSIMGCSSTKEPVKKISIKKTPPTFGRRTDLDPKNFMFVKQTSEVCVRAPGSIEGQQFVVEDNESCDIYLLDHIASMNVDSCKSCRIVTGPVSSSVFLRDCSDCVVVLACQQLRLRNCHNMKILLFSTTGPIIESSSDIDFGCYSYRYFDMDRHFEAAELSAWNNQWSDVYDFTPGGEGQTLSAAPCNHHLVVDSAQPSRRKYQYKLLPPNIDHRALLGGGVTGSAAIARLREALGSDLDLSEDTDVSSGSGDISEGGVLASCGIEECYRFAQARVLGRQPSCFQVFLVVPLALGEALRGRLRKWLVTPGNTVVKSRLKLFTADQWAQVEGLVERHDSSFKAVSSKQKKKLAMVVRHEATIVLHLMASATAELDVLERVLNTPGEGEGDRSEFELLSNYVGAFCRDELALVPAGGGSGSRRKDLVSELAHHIFHLWKEKDSH